MLFNEVLARREADGSWCAVLPGDVAKKHETGGLFLVASAGPPLDEARAQAARGGISATGPMFGAKMRWPEGSPLEIEREVLGRWIGDPSVLEGVRHAGEGTRRALRMVVRDFALSTRDETVLVVSFTLPKGGYATTVLGRACRLLDAQIQEGDVAHPHNLGERSQER
jgi:tRNA pseudouridine13 synthase